MQLIIDDQRISEISITFKGTPPPVTELVASRPERKGYAEKTRARRLAALKGNQLKFLRYLSSIIVDAQKLETGPFNIQNLMPDIRTYESCKTAWQSLRENRFVESIEFVEGPKGYLRAKIAPDAFAFIEGQNAVGKSNRLAQ